MFSSARAVTVALCFQVPKSQLCTDLDPTLCYHDKFDIRNI